MTTPSWLGDGHTLLPGNIVLLPLARLFAVVSPPVGTPLTFRPLPVVVQRVVSLSESGTWEGTATLWGSDRARFGISATAAGTPTSAWVAKPMTFASNINLPGLSTDVFWMILQAQVADDPWFLHPPDPTRPPDPTDPAHQPVLAMARHLVGPVVIAGKRMLVRLDVLGESMTASVDFTAALTAVERAAIGADPGDFHDNTHGLGLGFADLAHLFGNTDTPDADVAWLPEPLRTPDLFTLNEVHLQIDPADEHKLVGVGVAVEFLGGGTRWPLVPGFDVLTVSNIVVRFDIDHPLDAAARFPRVSVSGDIGIGTATLRMGARWPDLAVEGHLGKGPIVVSELLAAAHLPALGDDGLKITELGFQARPGGAQASFALHARAADVLSIPIGDHNLLLSDLELNLALARGADRSVSVEVRGELDVGGTGLVLDAAGDHGGEGWTLQARLVGDPIDLGPVVDWIRDRFGPPPLPASLMKPKPSLTEHGPTISALAVEFHTASRDASLEIVTELSFGTVTGELELDLSLAHHGADHYASTVAGRFTIHPDASRAAAGASEHTFELVLAQNGADPPATVPAATNPAPGATAPVAVMLAAYLQRGPTTVGDLLDAVGIDLALPVVLADALLARVGDETLALADMGFGFDLSRLPLVGRGLAGQNLTLDLRLVAASGGWDSDHLTALNSHLPAGYHTLDLPAGELVLRRADLVVALTLDGETRHLDLGVELDRDKLPDPTPTGQAKAAAPTPPVPPPVRPTPGKGADVKWYPLQRAFGPVHLRRVGARYADGAIELLLDGDLSLGGLTLSLDGLSVSSPLSGLKPTFNLRGLGLDVRQGAFELGGMFLKLGPEEFAGAALLRTEKLSLSAIGAYAVIEGHPSLFVYAVLDYPLGGPAFFFVTGFAAGFGYNRRLVMPAIDRIAEFPLVAQAQAGTGGAELPGGAGLLATLQSFEEFLPPSLGDMFAAVGIKFTSFTLIDSFALLAVSMGTRLRIDLLGSSTLVAPTPVEGVTIAPVAEIHLGVHAQFLPDEGFLGVDARLTSASYVLSSACHLTGGAAFHSWFSGPHAGDFVVTMGGYHPAFRVPAHYPTVPRLGFEWQVTPEVALKGDMYFALTGHAIMAGGHLDASYNSATIAAWFRVGADFMIAWQPFAYDAQMYVHVGARWGALTFEVGADVHVWGPEFAGYAEVDLGITSFTTHFGDTSPPAVDPVDWATFRAASLPPLDAICTVACVRGLVATLAPARGFAAEWVVSAHDLVVEVASQIPADGCTFNGESLDGEFGPFPLLGVAPMDVAVGGLTSALHVTVLRDNAEEGMRLTPVRKTVPTALWGPPVPRGKKPDANAEASVRDTLAGFELRPLPRRAPRATTPVAREKMSYTPIPAAAGDPGRLPRPFGADGVGPAEEVARARAALLSGLGVDPGEVRYGPDPDDMYFPRPTAVTLTTEAS